MIRSIKIRVARTLRRSAERNYDKAVANWKNGLTGHDKVESAGVRCHRARQRLKALGVD